jgi:hypothetical protein
LAQQVFSPPLRRLCHAHHHLLPHHHHRTTTTTRQHTKSAEADLNIAANKLVMFLTASRYHGEHGSEAGLAEVKAFPRTQMAITFDHAPSLQSCKHTDMQQQAPPARRRHLHRGARAAKGRRRRRHGGRHGPAGLSAGTGLAHQLAPQVHPVEASILEHAQTVLKMPEKMFIADFVQVAASLLALSHADHLRRRQPSPHPLPSDKDTANMAVEKIPVDKKWAEYPDNLRH